MKIVLFLSLIALNISCFADEYKLEGESFSPSTNTLVVWDTTVTNLPNNLWVYRVIPQSFPLSIITNLLSLCKLQMINRVNKIDSQHLVFDKNFMRFIAENDKGKTLHKLDIAPTIGWMNYEDSSGGWRDPLEVAPTVDKSIQLAIDLSFEAGIDQSLINHKPHTMSLDKTQRGNSPEIITRRGVFLSRKIDGIDERGFCLFADYSTYKGEPKLMSFEINWRNLVPYKPYSVATTNEITDFIKSGRATTPPQPVDLSNLNNAKKLTITKFTPIYFSRPPMDRIEFEFPYAEMTLVADFGNTNTTTFYLNCPLLSTDSNSEVK